MSCHLKVGIKGAEGKRTGLITWAYGCRVTLSVISHTRENCGVCGVCSGLIHSSSRIWERGENQKDICNGLLAQVTMTTVNITGSSGLY